MKEIKDLGKFICNESYYYEPNIKVGSLYRVYYTVIDDDYIAFYEIYDDNDVNVAITKNINFLISLKELRKQKLKKLEMWTEKDEKNYQEFISIDTWTDDEPVHNEPVQNDDDEPVHNGPVQNQ